VVAARPFLRPAAFLLAVSLALIGWRWATRGAAHPSGPRRGAGAPAVAPAPAPRRFYRVRPGDTLASIAARTGVSVARLRRLNPHANPTALFLGERLRLP